MSLTSRSPPLPPKTKDILEQCPRFRILLVGRSGVGKSTLINQAFSVDKATVSDKNAGACNIEDEIFSPQNPRFVLHDSQGFMANETANLERVKEFIRSRSGSGVALKDQVHAVWLCIRIPVAGGRVLEIGDEKFINFATQNKVPIVVVFTQFDELVSRMEENLTDEQLETLEEMEINKLCLDNAKAEFERTCLGSLRNMPTTLERVKTSVRPGYRYTLRRLILRTQDLVERQIEGDVWIVSAMAQRASAQVKTDSSIAVGMKKYWQGLASSANFPGLKLEDCLLTIHIDITSSWNFHDPDDLLVSEEFRDNIKAITQLFVPDASEVNSWFHSVVHTTSIAAIIAAPLAPTIAAIGLSAMFIRLVKSVYDRTPKVLRCLMGYIVNLTLVMERLFLHALPLDPPRSLTRELIAEALEDYENSNVVKEVYREIREYVNESTWDRILRANDAQEKVKSLIRQHQAPDV